MRTKGGPVAPFAEVVRVVMTDGSTAMNVRVRGGGGTVTFACADRPTADALAAEVNRCAWVDVYPV